jgi:Flp pilus assembly protein TadG
MGRSRFKRGLGRDERGNALAIAAAAMPLMIGASAIAVDTINLTLTKRELQREADSAAIAGAYGKLQGFSASTSAQRDLTINTKVPLATTTIENAPAAGPFTGNNRAVRVILTSSLTTPLMGFFGTRARTIRVEATAESVFTGHYCMVSLESGAVTGITFSGSTSVDLGCGIVTNSKSNAAISAGGSASIHATPVAAVGNVPFSTAYADGTTLLPWSPSQADPYAALPRTPSPPANCTWVSLDSQPNRTTDLRATISPDGNYCVRNGVDIKGTTILAPGIYYIDGGTFSLGAQANLQGTGVTFILTSSTPANPASFATVSMNGGAVATLTAPTSGTYAGLLFYQDPRTPAGSSTINGNSASSFQGGLYFPSRQLLFNGNTGMHTECLQLVARTLVFSGNSAIQNTCPADSGAHDFDATFVRLVA